MKLDGTEKIAPTPFDAHDKVVREVEHEHREYPKAITHDLTTGEPIIATDEAHEAELLATPEEGTE